MSSIEIPDDDNNIFDDHEVDAQQLTLPFDIRIPRKVHWINALQVEKKRRFRPNRLITKLILDEDSYMPTVTAIPADDISKITDPDLRYALRFSDATVAVGWISDGPHSRHMHDVSVVATDEGVGSKLIDATYTGIVTNTSDTFMENLRSAEPRNF